MTEKKVTVAVAPKRVAAPKKITTTKRASTKKPTLVVNAESVSFRAGDVYQALAVTDKALSVAEIAKAAKIGTEEVYLGIGQLFKEGKIKDSENLFTLA